MKKYSAPLTFVGIDALHELTISLHTWIEWLHPLTLEDDKPQIELISLIIRRYIHTRWLTEI